MSQPPFSAFLTLWKEILQPALQEWRALSDEEKQEWERTCPPRYKNGMTFFLLTCLYGPLPPDETPPSQG